MKERFKPLKGHKLKRDWTGAESSYANGRCECGHWRYRGWTSRMRDVISSHHNHVERIRAGKGIPGSDVPELTDQQKAEQYVRERGYENAVTYLRGKVAGHHSWQSVLDELLRMTPEQ